MELKQIEEELSKCTAEVQNLHQKYEELGKMQNQVASRLMEVQGVVKFLSGLKERQQAVVPRAPASPEPVLQVSKTAILG